MTALSRFLGESRFTRGLRYDTVVMVLQLITFYAVFRYVSAVAITKRRALTHTTRYVISRSYSLHNLARAVHWL